MELMKISFMDIIGFCCFWGTLILIGSVVVYLINKSVVERTKLEIRIEKLEKLSQLE